MRHGIEAVEDQIERVTPWWEQEWSEAGYEYEDMEDHPYNIMGAEPGQRYGS